MNMIMTICNWVSILLLMFACFQTGKIVGEKKEKTPYSDIFSALVTVSSAIMVFIFGYFFTLDV